MVALPTVTRGIVSVAINGLPITFREDGYINMTKAAKHFGKKLSNFWRNPDTWEYLEALKALPQFEGTDLFVAKRGGNLQGSWCHPKLAVFFARWLDVRFAVWCDLMIDNILKGHIQTQVVVATEEALGVMTLGIHTKAP